MGAALRAVYTLGRSLTQLTLPVGIGDSHPDDGIEPVDLMPDLHLIPGIWTPIAGYDRLLPRVVLELARLGVPEKPVRLSANGVAFVVADQPSVRFGNER